MPGVYAASGVDDAADYIVRGAGHLLLECGRRGIDPLQPADPLLAAIRREMKRRPAVEPVIGHLRVEHRMGRNYLKGPDGDRINAILAAAGYNFGLPLRWLAELVHAFIRHLPKAHHSLRPSDSRLFAPSAISG